MQEQLILDLGCGKNKQKDAFGVEGVDLVWDLNNFPYPWENNSVNRIYCHQVIEHFNCEIYFNILREIHRILKPGGIFSLRVPHAYCIGSIQDPTHKSFFTIRSIDYFSNTHPVSYYKATDFKFKIVKNFLDINCFYNWTRLTPFQRIINKNLSFCLNLILKYSPTLCEYIIKIFPFWYVDIGWLLIKEDATFDN